MKKPGGKVETIHEETWWKGRNNSTHTYDQRNKIKKIIYIQKKTDK